MYVVLCDCRCKNICIYAMIRQDLPPVMIRVKELNCVIFKTFFPSFVCLWTVCLVCMQMCLSDLRCISYLSYFGPMDSLSFFHFFFHVKSFSSNFKIDGKNVPKQNTFNAQKKAYSNLKENHINVFLAYRARTFLNKVCIPISNLLFIWNVNYSVIGRYSGAKTKLYLYTVLVKNQQNKLYC